MSKNPKTSKLNAVESQFKTAGEQAAEPMALSAVRAGVATAANARKNLEVSGYEAAEDMGINKGHAKLIIDAVLAQFDKDVADAGDDDVEPLAA